MTDTGGVSRAQAPAQESVTGIKPPRSAKRMFASTVLALEAFVVLFASLAAYGLRAVEPMVILGVGLGGFALCVLAAGMLRSAVGYALGWLIQAGLIVAGILVPELRVHLLAVAVTFTVIWVVSLRVGARIDVERAERYEGELAFAREREASEST